MKVMVVDDEPLARSRLLRLLADHREVQVVGEAANGREALGMCEQLTPELVLMDIRMPVMDGLEAAHHLAASEHPPSVVFTTAYEDHALDAFEASAVDYLLKPIREDRLSAALRKVGQRRAAAPPAAPPLAGPRSHICVRVRGDLQLVATEEVRCFLAEQKYVTVVFEGGELLIEESLKSLEQEFAGHFTRVHRNALAANRYLQGLEKDPEGRQLLVLAGTARRLEVSRRHLPELRRMLREARLC